jgi:hypothetical protein
MDAIIKKLRNKESVRLWDTSEKLFHHIQLNKKEKFICWERWVSKDRRNWVNWNLYLSLKDIKNLHNKILTNKN